MKQYDYLIVGAGLYGATFAYLVGQAGKRCLVIEKCSQLGGNLYCEPLFLDKKGGDMACINVHKYGAHIFHTSDKRIWDFVTSLVPFNRFSCHGREPRLFNLPFNMNTFYQMWGVTDPRMAKSEMGFQVKKAVEEINERHERMGVPLVTPSVEGKGWDGALNLEEQALLLVGKDVYETLIKGYTEKQWGRSCRELPADIIRRIPVRFTFDNNYFDDLYQGVPVGGYNILIDRLLKKADKETGEDFFDDRSYWEGVADKIVYTGPLDRYFSYVNGCLEWRSLRFEHQVLPIPDYQGNAVVNYTDAEVPYTRIIEHKHFEYFGQHVDDILQTAITKEYPVYGGGSDPYYPINDLHNNALADSYRLLAEKEHHVIFGGRLAEYRYYDMDDVIARVFEQTKHL